jgi:hypothetical protein
MVHVLTGVRAGSQAVSRIGSMVAGLLVFACGACMPHANTTSGRATSLSSVALDLLTMSGSYPTRKRVLDLAEEKLVEQCMAGHGQIYQSFVPSLLVGSDEERIVDLPRRRTEGYGLAPGQPTPPHVAPNADQPEYQRALFGDDQHRQELRLPNGAVHSYPTTGCVAESRATLYGDTVRWARVVSVPQVYDNYLRAQTRDASELASAITDWASCMAAAGYPHPNPEAASNDISAAYRLNGPSPDLRRREIAVAVSDGTCALRVHLPATDLQLRRGRAEFLPADQRRDLNEIADLHCAAHRNAVQISPDRGSLYC